MASPRAALLTQRRNIQAGTGTLPQLIAAVQASGAARHGERHSWLMEQFRLGHGHANTVGHAVEEPLPDLGGGAAVDAPAAAGDAQVASHAGAKARLRPLHRAVMKIVRGQGGFERAPKKTCVTLRRMERFVLPGPTTKELLEIGFNAKVLPTHARLKVLARGGLCQVTTRLGGVGEVDAELRSWLKKAFAAADRCRCRAGPHPGLP